GFFDVIVVDAPCSGSGLFRKQEDAIGHWSEENVKHCSLRQQRILHDLFPALKQNGVLIYSTCSYSKEENEDMCDHLCREFSLGTIQLKIENNWGITETTSSEGAFGYRFFPHLAKGEGFFLACFKKAVHSVHAASSIRAKPGNERLSVQEEKLVTQVLGKEGLSFESHHGEIVGFNKAVWEEVKLISSSLKIKKMPLHIGQLKGKDFVPHPYLAYINYLSDEVNKIEVDTETALKYLRKQAFTINGPQKGFELLMYKNRGLGWLKNLGSRVNNYYPAEWRILKEVF
ncbi:MAG TPA: hypothetical protein VNY73_08175, partial [Bacteroidia bacterium]|nr:hypothetical protein [Bacteroidia bacterium]